MFFKVLIGAGVIMTIGGATAAIMFAYHAFYANSAGAGIAVAANNIENATYGVAIFIVGTILLTVGVIKLMLQKKN